MAPKNKMLRAAQAGFSLVEIIVGMVIGLIVTLIIAQTIGTFEGQKIASSAGTDAQTSGTVALYTIQRQIQMSGYGVPIFTRNSPLKCANSNTTFDHDNDTASPPPGGATPAISISPVIITDGGVGVSDTITLGRGLGDLAGLPVTITDFSAMPNIVVENNMGCKKNDAAIIISADGSTCAMRKVVDIPAGTTKITLNTADTSDVNFATAKISCPGEWLSNTYSVANGSLLENGRPIMANIVGLQAQYGVAASEKLLPVTDWVDATGIWANPTVANRNRIRAVRLAIVARNENYERDVVVDNGVCTTGLCTWAGNNPATAASTATLTLAAIPSWDHYRYRVFETTVPLRNIIWSSNNL